MNVLENLNLRKVMNLRKKRIKKLENLTLRKVMNLKKKLKTKKRKKILFYKIEKLHRKRENLLEQDLKEENEAKNRVEIFWSNLNNIDWPVRRKRVLEGERSVEETKNKKGNIVKRMINTFLTISER